MEKVKFGLRSGNGDHGVPTIENKPKYDVVDTPAELKKY